MQTLTWRRGKKLNNSGSDPELVGNVLQDPDPDPNMQPETSAKGLAKSIFPILILNGNLVRTLSTNTNVKNSLGKGSGPELAGNVLRDPDQDLNMETEPSVRGQAKSIFPIPTLKSNLLGKLSTNPNVKNSLGKDPDIFTNQSFNQWTFDKPLYFRFSSKCTGTDSDPLSAVGRDQKKLKTRNKPKKLEYFDHGEPDLVIPCTFHRTLYLKLHVLFSCYFLKHSALHK